jgi:hypothetical protein
MPTKPAIPPIDHDLYSQIFILGSYSFTVREKQIETKDHLFKLLHSMEPGAIYELPEALREHGRAYIHNIRGEVIPGENWIRDTAYHLASQVEMHIRTSSPAALPLP